jgi:hypothetical protein
MEIHYTGHARMRMTERSVSETDIAVVLSDPDVRYTDADGNPNFVRFIDGRRIRVVIAAGSSPARVITVIAPPQLP